MKPEAWALLQYDPALKENRLVGIYLDPALANADALKLETQATRVTVEPFELTTESMFGDAGPITTEVDVPLHVA